MYRTIRKQPRYEWLIVMDAMLSPLWRLKGLLSCLLVAVPLTGSSALVAPFGSNFRPSGEFPGDQTFPKSDLNPRGGYLVWEDAGIDGEGKGIAARRVDANQSAIQSRFLVNSIRTGNQEKPSVVVFPDDGAAVVWQGGSEAYRDIFLRLLAADGTFVGSQEIRVNQRTNTTHQCAAIGRVANGNMLVAWGSEDGDGHLQGIRARVVDAQGGFVTDAFEVNQNTTFNQRDPAVVGLPNGKFVVVWVSENQGVPALKIFLGKHEIHVMARIFSATGEPISPEFQVDSGAYVCTGPSVAESGDGDFLVVWAQEHERPTGWDIMGRLFNGEGGSKTSPFRVNSFPAGDQFAPSVGSTGRNNLVAWTSLGQDGSWEGVFTQAIVNGEKSGPERPANVETVGGQHQPSVSGDGADDFLVSWSSFTVGDRYDIVSQRFDSVEVLIAPSAPHASALSQTRIMVTWPDHAGLNIDQYEVFVNGAQVPSVVTESNIWLATGLTAGATYSFQIGLILENGQRSPRSEPVTVMTWTEDLNADGLPDNWQMVYWGTKSNDWEPAWVDSDGDGVSNFNELLAGSDPRDPNSVFRITIESAGGVSVVGWQSRPGFVYQLQISNDLENWVNHGTPRFSPGTSDSVAIQQGDEVLYYRLMRVR